MNRFDKDLIQDLDCCFFNDDEFSHLHMIEGKEIRAIIDDEQMESTPQSYLASVEEQRKIVFIKTKDLSFTKRIGGLINIDGKEMMVENWQEKDGLTTITVKRGT